MTSNEVSYNRYTGEFGLKKDLYTIVFKVFEKSVSVFIM